MFKAAQKEREATAERPRLAVSSPTLKSGEPIPRDYTADGRNMSPPLTLVRRAAGHEVDRARLRGSGRGQPAAVRALGDLQHSRRRRRGCPENIPFEPDAPMPAAIAGADAGRLRLSTPDLSRPGAAARQGASLPLRRLRARRGPGLQPGLTRADLLDAINGHVIGQGELVATYERKHHDVHLDDAIC